MSGKRDLVSLCKPFGDYRGFLEGLRGMLQPKSVSHDSFMEICLRACGPAGDVRCN
jgi:hypothetical protein